jgi:hypothetical protein
MKFNKQNREALKFINNYLDTSFKMGAYPIVLQGYQYLDTYYPSSSNEFIPDLAKCWGTASKMFRNLSNKIYFVSSLDKYKLTLTVPQELNAFRDFCYAIEEYYSLKRGYINPTEEEFWWAIFHRSIFEEGLDDIAKIAAKKLKITTLPFIAELIIKQTQETLENLQEEQQLTPDITVGGMDPQKISITLRIQPHQPIKLYSHIVYGSEFSEERLFQIDENWDDLNLVNLYHALPKPGDLSTIKDIVSQQEFCKIAFLTLPKQLRQFSRQLKLKSNQIPELFIITDEASIPFELIMDHKSPFGVKYGIGYRFKEPKLTHSVKNLIQTSKVTPDMVHKIRILSLSDLNSEVPRSWDEKVQKNTPLFAYAEGTEIYKTMNQKIQELNTFVESFQAFNHRNCTYKELQNEITSGQYQIIHIASNLFYLEESPLDSYFISPDNQCLSMRDFIDMLSFGRKKNTLQKTPFIRPLIIFTGRVIDQHQNPISRSFTTLAKIHRMLESKHILGFYIRISSEWNQYLQDGLLIFLERILLGESIGSALITANRHQYITVRNLFNDSNTITLGQILSETHFTFFGEPWCSLDY